MSDDELFDPPPNDEGASYPTISDELNGPQADAVAHVDGPLVVFAGAGSGKTRVITYRIANLCAVHRVPPYRVLAVTFTNKAAGEMKHRLGKLIGDDLTKSLWVGTFHALSARLLRTFHADVGLSRNFVIYDDADQKAVMNRVVKELGLDDKRYPPRQLLSKVHKEKQEGRRAQDFVPGNYFDDVFRRAYEAYEKRLLEANAVDFDDLLLDGMRLAESKERAGIELRRKFRYVLVDEFQDVNQVQYRFVRALTAESRNLCVVGDDDQSIYRWRGADVQIVRNFRHDYPDATVIKLEQNYRSSGHIVDAALGVIKPARDREPKELWTDNHPGELVRVVATSTERDEAALVVGRVKQLIDGGVSPSEIAIFYRVHAQSRVLEEVMRASQIAYQIVGGTRFFERAEIKDILSYLRVLSNPKSDVDLERIINVPPRKIGKSTVTLLAEEASRQGSSLLDALVPLTAGASLGTAAKKALIKFRELILELTVVARTAPPSELAQTVLELTGYRALLEQEETDESDARLGNLDEFVGSIAEYEEEAASAGEVPSLDSYLERVTLSAGLDEMKDAPKVVMMTVHAAKGLEFSYVMVTGMEEDIFPFKSRDPDRKQDDEEERRLAYVAFTRARRELLITHAERRMIFGTTTFGTPSRFITNIPKLVVSHEVTDLRKNGNEGRYIDRERESSREWTGQRGGGWTHPMTGRMAGGSSPAARGSSAVEAEVHRSPKPPVAPGERYVEHDDEHSLGSLTIGGQVRHSSFGTGVVEGIDGGDDPTITVRFVGRGAKRIKLRFLELA